MKFSPKYGRQVLNSFVRRQIGQEPKPPEIHAEHGHLAIAHLPCRPKNCAIASKDQGQVGRNLRNVALTGQVGQDDLTPSGPNRRGNSVGRFRHVRLGPVPKDEETHVGKIWNDVASRYSNVGGGTSSNPFGDGDASTTSIRRSGTSQMIATATYKTHAIRGSTNASGIATA